MQHALLVSYNLNIKSLKSDVNKYFVRCTIFLQGLCCRWWDALYNQRDIDFGADEVVRVVMGRRELLIIGDTVEPVNGN